MTLRFTKTTRLLLIGLLVLGWFVFLRPASVGGPLGSVLVTGVSMEPTIHDGDLVLTQAQESYEVGDVVAFDTGGAIVIHRIVGGSGDEGFVMQGDNNDRIDTWHPRTEDVIGKRWIRLPGLGTKVRQLQANPGLLGGLVGALVAVVGLRPADRRRPAGSTPAVVGLRPADRRRPAGSTPAAGPEPRHHSRENAVVHAGEPSTPAPPIVSGGTR